MEESTGTRSTGTVETSSSTRGYYMEDNSTGTVETNSTEMSDSSTRGSPMQTGSPPPPACLDHTYYSIQVLQDKLF